MDNLLLHDHIHEKIEALSSQKRALLARRLGLAEAEAAPASANLAAFVIFG